MALVESDLKVFVINYEGRKKVAFGKSLKAAFGGVVPVSWKKFQDYGELKEYTIAEYFKEGVYVS